MKRISCVLFGLIFLFPCFLKAQKGKIIWERGGQIGNQIQGDIPFSPDSSEFGLYSHLASGFEIRSSNTGKVLRVLPKINSGSMAWSPKGKFIAVYDREFVQGNNNTIGVLTLVDPVDGKVFKTIKPYEGSLEFSPEGNYLAAQKYIYEDPTVYKIDDTTLTSIQFPWTTYIVLPGDTTALVFKNDSLLKVSFPDGNLIKYYHTLSPLSAGEFSKIIFHKSTGRMAIPYFYKKLVVADINTGEVFKTYTDEDYYRSDLTLSFTPDGNSLAIGRSDFSLLNLTTDSLITIANYGFWNQGNIYFNNKGQALLLASANGGDCYPTNFDRMWLENSLRIWDMDRNERVIIDGMGHDNDILSLKISDDNETVRSIDADSTALTWDIETGSLLEQEKVSELSPVSMYGDVISPSGKYLLKTTAELNFELWDRNTNTILHSLPYKTQSAPFTRIFGKTFSSDEKHILASLEYEYIGWSGNDFPRQELYFWSTETGQKTDSIPLPCFLSHIQVSNDNTYIAGTTFDNQVIVIGAEGLLTSVEDAPIGAFKTMIYPNPVIENSTISYSVPTPGLLKISVHDIFGREIMVLKNEFSELGNFTLPFKSGELSSGTYFLKVMSGGEVTTTQFSILR